MGNVKDEIVTLLTDFGCYQSDNSYVYANGDSASARFSLKVPNWVVEFRCELAVCDWGDDCGVKCGTKGPRLRRDLKNSEEIRKAEEAEKERQKKNKENSQRFDDTLGTTDSPYIPIGTTANTIIEEIWDEQRDSLEGISVTEVVFGPLHWPSAMAPQTTMLPDVDTTILPTDDKVYTTDSSDEVDQLLDETPDKKIVSTVQPELSTQFDNLEEIEFVEEVEIIKEHDLPKDSLPPWSSMLIILLSAAAFIVAFIALVLRYFKSKNEKKLINASY